MQNLQPLGAAAKSVQLTLAGQDAKPVTQVTLFDQGIVQVLQAAVTGLSPKQPLCWRSRTTRKAPATSKRLRVHDQSSRRCDR